ncbi:hypothetical protein GCK72_011148 [Caenorhabditis remanei]|uniref:PAN-3 domain-containing protein n=1 Tax=Caenorhabditis remanei TaxID=31234 RepID=A0A6A5H7W1_CAERE|nr:hypothetical protein GCK72_011148 [Caenorhabditis remanei]KAF1762884.1 hypothetical protein GCK72_011148 [Caenorhabditis remanei]
MLYFTIFLLFLLFPSVESNTKIVVVWGVPVEQSALKVNDWNTCITQCLNDVQCVLIQKTATGCSLFHLGSVKTVMKTGKDSGKKVGIKRTLNTCSNGIDPPMFGQSTVSETFVYNGNNYKYNITKIGTTGWSFGFSNTIQCPPDSFLSVRDKNQVCISVQLFPGPNYCKYQADGIKLCQSVGAIGLTGPYNSTEGKIITEIAASKSKKIPSGINGFQNFWIDGDRTGKTTVKVSDPTLNGVEGYDWQTSLTKVDETYSCVYLGTKGQPTSNRYHNIWTECSTLCLDNVQCVLIQKAADGCHLYHLENARTIRKTDRASGGIVGFKRTMDTCPNSDDAPMFGQSSVQETFVYNENNYKYNITKTVTNKTTMWSFGFSNTIQCPSDSFLSVRGKNQVCISVRLFSGPNYCTYQADGIKLCQTIGGIGLTGPFSFTEGEKITKLAAFMSKGTPSGQEGYQNFWIDGNRTGETTVKVSDPTLNGTTGYDWKMSLTKVDETYSCVYLGTNDDYYGKTYIYVCTLYSGAKFCMRGAICRTKPVTYY